MYTLKFGRKIMLIVLIVILVCFLNSCVDQNSNTLEAIESENQDQAEKDLSINSIEELVGVWHASPSLGAGWNDNYHFFKDMTFRLDYSQYDESKRIIDIAGEWSVSEGELILTVTQKTVVKGGQLEKSSPSAVSEYKIVNGKIKKEQLNLPEKIVYALSKIEKDESYPYPIMIKIDGKQFWKFNDDPTIN